MRLVGACIEMLSSGEVVEQCQGKRLEEQRL